MRFLRGSVLLVFFALGLKGLSDDGGLLELAEF